MRDAARFSGRSVLVTGASRGLGRAVAVAFAREGARVGVGYRVQRRAADETAEHVRAAGGEPVIVSIDVDKDDSVRAAIETFAPGRAPIDVLVNNAAIVHDAPAVMASAADALAVVNTSLGGSMRCTLAVARPMIAAGRGAIVNVASLAGLRASPGQSSYGAAKGGLIAWTRTIAAELAPHGVRVNAVAPGVLQTGMAARLDRDRLARLVDRVPLGRAGTGEEVAAAVLFLASDDAAYVVGQTVCVDGGLGL